MKNTNVFIVCWSIAGLLLILPFGIYFNFPVIMEIALQLGWQCIGMAIDLGNKPPTI